MELEEFNTINNSIEHKRFLKTLYLVTCKSCGIDRVLPGKYKSKYNECDWENNFACYKLKFREIFCEDNSFSFKEFDGFNHNEILTNLQHKRKMNTLARERT